MHSGIAYYVDCAARSSGTGTAIRPWNSLAAVTAHKAFGPGDSILLRRGTRCTGRIEPRGSGRNGEPIVLGAFGAGPKPIIDAGGSPDQTGAVQLTNVHDWVVQDLAVTNAAAQQSTTMRAGILVLNEGAGLLGRIIIRNNSVFGVTSSPGSASADPHAWGGIAVIVDRATATAQSSFTDVSISGNRVQRVGRSGIVVWNDNYEQTMTTDVDLAHNEVLDAEGDSILLLGVDHGVIERNVSLDGGHLPACEGCAFTAYNTASAGIWPTRSRSIWIIGNEVSGEGAAGGDGEGLDIDEQTSDVVMAFNYSHDNDGGGVLLCGAEDADVRFNVFRSNGGGEVTFSCPWQGAGIRIFNNVIDIPSGSTTAVVRRVEGSGTAPILFANNLIANEGTAGYGWPAPVVSMNNWYAGSAAAVLSDSGSQTGPAPFVTEPSDLAGFDALLGYQDVAGSAASTGGAEIENGGSMDLFGATLSTPMPIGVGVSGRLAAEAAEPTDLEVQKKDADGFALSWSAASDVVYDVDRRTACTREFEAVARSLNRPVFTDDDVECASRGAVHYRVRTRTLFSASPWATAVAAD